MARISLGNVCKSFKGLKVIKSVSLTVEDGEFCVFVGPSGCGKSTLLRMIAGLEDVTSGQILIDDQDVTKLEPFDRQLSMVFQSYALYPHLTVRQNIAFALETAKQPKEVIECKVAEAARTLKLEDYLDRRPSALSGGQRQRVAIGRAIVREPRAFLFDEPLSNLDAALRGETRVEIASLHKSLAATMIYVTHDQVEAMTLADRIVVLNKGEIMQVGSPRELYEHPGNVFVAQFLGSPRMNLIDAASDGEAGVMLPGNQRLDIGQRSPENIRTVGVRPEQISITDDGDAAIKGTIKLCEYHGSVLSLIVDAGPMGDISVLAPSAGALVEGARVSLDLPADALHFFDELGHRVTPSAQA
ncbi:ABC transporter ATP-binding protein [Roseibium marinum]|uniref:Multiple sugar transport system ATP-binding protein n=1 Tax=Roseibium marinum TaxID=281252 RepID=A0A2S3UJR3_9HYPH|nr:ABC transporter ATP-binding protein [Roseibium marinum]POF27958.1 multiple sugar transport system ATP-binding protein [Roseibium marinum]